MLLVHHPHGHVFDIFDFREIWWYYKHFLKSILVQKIASTFIFDVIVLCFVVRYFISILELQSSRWGRESWLLCLICLPGVSWWLNRFSSRCHGVVCGLWLWYFLIILIYFYYVPWTFWNKEEIFACPLTVKNRQLSTVPLNFDCSRVWQWTVNSTTVAFGSESVKQFFQNLNIVDL